MNIMSNFKIPKIDIPKFDSSILPSISDFGINTGEVGGMVKNVVSKFDPEGKIDLSKYPNLKEKALSAIKTIPTYGRFSFTSLIPDSFFDQIDTSKMQSMIDQEIGGLNFGSMANLNLPNDFGDLREVITPTNGLGDIDFDSIYSMESIGEYQAASVGSDFNIDELNAEINQISSIAHNEFDMNQYMKEFADIQL